MFDAFLIPKLKRILREKGLQNDPLKVNMVLTNVDNNFYNEVLSRGVMFMQKIKSVFPNNCYEHDEHFLKCRPGTEFNK